jgi:Glycosyl hydrolase family 26
MTNRASVNVKGEDDSDKPDLTATETKSRQRRWIFVAVFIIAALVVGSVLSLPSGFFREAPQQPATSQSAEVRPTPDLRARKLLGTPPSGGPWFSGAWAGGDDASTKRVVAFGSWRGTPTDAATVYTEIDTWQEIYDSNWHITTFKGFDGVLSFGVPILPEEARGDFPAVVQGKHDRIYKDMARDLKANGRKRSIVRIGWEANGDWFPWSAEASDAADYVAAYRHIVGVMREITPDLVIDFDLGCGTPLRGQTDRLDALRLLYPGDDVVDAVGCDFFDWYTTAATDDASWLRSTKPENAVGIQDIADFARVHGKGLTYPEWGLASREEGGTGDNSFFIEKVRSFFEANVDILVLENYFSEPATSLANSIWDPVQMPKSAKLYARLW